MYLFRAFPQVAALYQRRFRHILVDEYQDTNHAQYALIRELTKAGAVRARCASSSSTPLGNQKPGDAIPGASLTVVGDSDQSIYAFRGADIRNIVEFERDFPNSKVILLEQNYRSTQTILDAANSVIANNFDRKAKNLFTTVGSGDKILGFTGYSQHDEAQFIADEISKLRDTGVAYSDMAVFYRTNSQTRALEDIFIRSALPYKVLGGTKFYERAEIKDAMAYLITVANPADPLALRRIMNTPKRGIGPATEAALQGFADDNGMTLREAMRHVDELGLGPKLTAAIAQLTTDLDEVLEMSDPDRPTGRGGRRRHPDRAHAAHRLCRRPARIPRPAGRGARRERRRAHRGDEGVPAQQPRRHAARLPHRGRADRRHGRDRGLQRHGLAHDPAHREGPGVRLRVHHRGRGGPAAAPDVGERARRSGGGAAAVLRRHHPGAAAAVPVARDDPRILRRDQRRRAEPVPHRDPGRAHRLEAVGGGDHALEAADGDRRVAATGRTRCGMPRACQAPSRGRSANGPAP